MSIATTVEMRGTQTYLVTCYHCKRAVPMIEIHYLVRVEFGKALWREVCRECSRKQVTG